jgi:putative two-component system response regulator
MNEGRELIVMVDDDPTILRAGKNVLSEKYSVVTLTSAGKLFAFLETVSPVLILLDVMMPELDGYEAIKILKAKRQTRDIPVIFLTGKTDSGDEVMGLQLGAVDYITKPFIPDLLLMRIDVHLLVESQRRILEAQRWQLQNFNSNLLRMVEQKTRTVFVLQNAIIKSVADMVEYRDNITGGHDDRTRRGVGLLINGLMEQDRYREQIANWDVEMLVQSSQLHDVGKIAINDGILRKPGPLAEQEFAEMKRHTDFGIQLIDQIRANAVENEFLKYAKVFAATHHERWDGTGYPNGLKGEEIPLLGRIMAIADVYDALVSKRSYKEPFSHEEAVNIILGGRGTQFDPYLVDLFMTLADRFKGMEIDAALIEKLKEGVKLINEQHQRIFDYTTDLFIHCQGDEDSENKYFGATISRALDLVMTHFKTEEELMLETRLDMFEYIEHKKEHEGFITALTEFISQFEKTGAIDLLNFASYAKGWVIDHIKQHDKKYINYFNKITEGCGIEEMQTRTTLMVSGGYNPGFFEIKENKGEQ